MKKTNNKIITNHTSKNDTDFVDTSITVSKETKKLILQCNLLIIKSVHNQISFYSKLKKTDFYEFLGISKDTLDEYICSGDRYISTIARKLITLDISNEYLDIENENFQLICMDKDLQDKVVDYITYRTGGTITLKKLNENIRDNLYTIKNLDGSLIIEKIFTFLIHSAPNGTVQKSTYTLLNNLADVTPDFHISTKALRDYYNAVANEYLKNPKTDIIPITAKEIPDSKIYSTSTSNPNLCRNLLLIRELFLICAEMDGLDDPLKKFYYFIDYGKEEYNDAINTGKVKNRSLLKKLEPYKFPASVFRGDRPSLLDMSDSVHQALDTYFKDVSNCKNDPENQLLHTFQERLRIEILFRYDTKNLPIILSIYSIIKDLKKQDELLKTSCHVAELLSQLNDEEIQELKKELSKNDSPK